MRFYGLPHHHLSSPSFNPYFLHHGERQKVDGAVHGPLLCTFAAISPASGRMGESSRCYYDDMLRGKPEKAVHGPFQDVADAVPVRLSYPRAVGVRRSPTPILS